MIKIKLTFYDIISFIFKHKWFVLLFTIVASAMGFFAVNKAQTYTAQGVIRYIDLDTELGYTPQENKLDVNEIISPRIISEAIKTLGVEENAESIRSNCTITGIIPSDVQELKEANQKDGEEYEYFPKDYIISYTVGSDKSPEYARDMVDAILTAYTNYYSSTYLSTYTLPEIKFDTIETEHDYLETADIINTAVNDCSTYFESSAEGNDEFRSPRTGYTFSDMSRFYNEIEDVQMPDIFSKIIDGHITKDKEIFLKKYGYKIEQERLESESQTRNSETAFDLMEKFVNANKDVPSAYGVGDDDDEKYHSYEVHDLPEDIGTYAPTTYDQLVDKYVVDGVAAGESDIDRDYYQLLYDTFDSEIPDYINTEELTEEIETQISETVSRVDELYDITNIFLDDFRRYQLTKNINMLTNITTKSNNPDTLFKALVIMICILLGCVIAIAYEIIILAKKNNHKYGETF